MASRGMSFYNPELFNQKIEPFNSITPGQNEENKENKKLPLIKVIYILIGMIWILAIVLYKYDITSTTESLIMMGSTFFIIFMTYFYYGKKSNKITNT